MAERQIAPLMEAAVAGDRQARRVDLSLDNVSEITEGKEQAGRHDGGNQIDKICRRQLERHCIVWSPWLLQIRDASLQACGMRCE